MGKLSDQNRKRRRLMLKGLAGISLLSLHEKILSSTLLKKNQGSSTVHDEGSGTQVSELKGKLPYGKLGNLDVSRIILGCNTITAASHSRDLIYCSKLFRAYNTEEKTIQTLKLAEDSGINSFVLIPETYAVLNKYRDQYKSNMKTICMARIPAKDFFSDIQLSIDCGADAVYIHGRVCDAFVRDGKMKELQDALNYIKKRGLQAGVGAHCLETIQACEKEGIVSDFYMKTFHHDKYWSALPVEDREQYIEIGPSHIEHNKYCDNMWDLYPEKTVGVMKEVKKPFVAFKILAAGAIQPKVGFRYAFENGADFICVGMFDFQIVDNVNLACGILADLKNRERGWYS